MVKLGIHKETGEKVAIKILTKKDMPPKELELAKTEIEILKICQHPNIVRVYDVFENLDYIYISKLIFIILYPISNGILRRRRLLCLLTKEKIQTTRNTSS